MNTPRTDAERRALKKAKSYPVDPVSAEFARRLEKELNLALWELACLQGNIDEARRIEREGLIKP